MSNLYRFQYYTDTSEALSCYVIANSWPEAFNVVMDHYRKVDIKTAEELANSNRNLFIDNNIFNDNILNQETVKIQGFDQFQDPEFRL